MSHCDMRLRQQRHLLAAERKLSSRMIEQLKACAMSGSSAWPFLPIGSSIAKNG